MLAWIPIVGPIITGIVDVWKGHQDLQGKLDKDDVDIIKARTTLLSQLKDDVGIRVARDFAMWFPITYVNIYIWDRMMDISRPEWVWGVKPLDLPWTTYLPVMAVYSFLFALAWRGPRA